MAAAASALPAPPALFPGAFLQSHALTKEGLLLGSPGDSVCAVGGPVTAVTCCCSPHVRASLLVLLAHSTHFPVTQGPLPGGGGSHSTLHMTVGLCWRRERAGSPPSQPPG